VLFDLEAQLSFFSWLQEMSKNIVIVGGGLAGLTAACELLERGCNVTVLEKNPHLGGNSSKATTGIAAPGCGIQQASNINDNGADLQGFPALGATKDVEWLLSLAGVKDEVRLCLAPGHGSTQRVLTTEKNFTGQVVTYAVVHQLQEIAKARPDRLKLITTATVNKLICEGNQVTGVEYSTDGTKTEKGTVLIATGGFAGDMAPTSFLARYAPGLMKCPTTSDERESGDGIALAESVKAGQKHMDKVLKTPMAAVIPGQENSSYKIVLSDVICGAGGKLINADGIEFVSSLETMQVRTDAMSKNKGPFRVLIAEKDTEDVKWLCDFYEKRNVMQKYKGAAELASAMGVPVQNIQRFGAGPFLVAVVTEAIYTCAGGITVKEGHVLTASQIAIPGLFAAGEVTACDCLEAWAKAGVPLLHTIYSGRTAARSIAKAAGITAQVEELKAIAKEAGSAAVDASKSKDVSTMSKDELIAYVKELESRPAAAAADASPAAPAGPTEADVAKHNTKEDCWVIINGEAIDVTKWIPIHPGGEKAILNYAGKDASEEWNMIHKQGTVEKNLAHVTKMGKVGAGGGGGGATAPAGGGGLSMADVATHNKKEDCWVVVNGEALDVTKWIPIHPGGEQAIMSYAGKDATEEWNMIHKPGTVEKNLAHVVKMGAVAGGTAPPPVAAAGSDDPEPIDGDGGIPGPIGAIVYMLKSIILMVMRTVFFTGNFVFTIDNNRKGTIRSAIFLITFTIVHALGNFVDMLGGPDELNGEGYLFDRIHWTGAFGLAKSFPYSVVEEYLLLAVVLHVSVALKRSWDISMGYTIATGRWNMLLSGLVVLSFITKHLQDFRFYPVYDYVHLNAPKYFVAFDAVLSGHIFTEPEGSKFGETVVARDLYSREVALFKDLNNVMLYTACVVVFATHLCLGWKKVIPADAMQIPRDHHQTVIYIGWVAAVAVAGMYISVPWYVFFATPQVVKHIEA